MASLTASAVSLPGLIFLRNMAFVTLTWGVFSALISLPFESRKTTLRWFLGALLGSVVLFGISLSHPKHQLQEMRPPSQTCPSSTGATLESIVQELGNTMMKACLVVSGVYIVLRGWSLLLVFSKTRIPDAPLAIVRFLVGALLCVGILGVGLSAHRSQVAAEPKSEPANGNVKER
jgi:hypothetical protein